MKPNEISSTHAVWPMQTSNKAYPQRCPREISRLIKFVSQVPPYRYIFVWALFA
jgi:hypothetical protein